MRDRHFARQRPIKGTPEAGTHWIGTAIMAGGSILGGLMGKSAAEDAAEAQAAIAQQQLDLAREQFDKQWRASQPYREQGAAGVNRLGYLLGVSPEGGAPGDVPDALMQGFTPEMFQADPGYQFRLGEGEKAINRAAAARGMYGSPATVKELTRFGQGLADQTYQDAFNRYQIEQGNRFNRLAALSGIGQTGVSQGINASQNFTANALNSLGNLGNAQAGGIMGGANAMIQGLTGATSGLADQANINRMLSMYGG